jgi:hypothetical protein
VGVPGRIRGLQAGSAQELNLVHVAPGEKTDERRFHRQFAEQRIRGEWFRLDGPLKVFLAPFLGRKQNEG